MHVILLGTAAGGGFPQWNCWCPTCRVAREDPARARPRTQSSIAFSADGERWFLGNASPDVREQIACLPHAAVTGVRHVPVEGIVLTDAELDHTLGVTLLREGRHLQLIATAAVHAHDRRGFAGAAGDAGVRGGEDGGGRPRRSRAARLSRRKRERPHDRDEGGARRSAALRAPMRKWATRWRRSFATRARESRARSFPAAAGSDRSCSRGSTRPSCSCSTERSGRTTSSIDWISRTGRRCRWGTCRSRARKEASPSLSQLSCRHKVYTHINNTNPMLVESSPERATVEAGGDDRGHGWDALRDLRRAFCALSRITPTTRYALTMSSSLLSAPTIAAPAGAADPGARAAARTGRARSRRFAAFTGRTTWSIRFIG